MYRTAVDKDIQFCISGVWFFWKILQNGWLSVIFEDNNHTSCLQAQNLLLKSFKSFIHHLYVNLTIGTVKYGLPNKLQMAGTLLVYFLWFFWCNFHWYHCITNMSSLTFTCHIQFGDLEWYQSTLSQWVKNFLLLASGGCALLCHKFRFHLSSLVVPTCLFLVCCYSAIQQQPSQKGLIEFCWLI